MTTSNPTRFLKDANNAGSATDLDMALKVFSGMVYEAFTAKTAFYDNTGNIMAQKILTGQGNSASWPIIGQEPPSVYHDPGYEMVGGDIKMTEKIVTVDEILVSHVDVPFRDLSISHFDVLSPFAARLGRSLAIDLDKKLAVIGVKAARHALLADVHNGGNQVLRDDAVSDAAAEANITIAYPNSTTGSGRFRDDVAELAQKMDEDDVPESNRFLFVSPYIRSILRHEAASFGTSGADGSAGNIYDPALSSNTGDLNKRIIGELEGFQVIMTNHMPTTDTTASGFGQAGGGGTLAVANKYIGKFDGLDDANKGDGAATGYLVDQAKANAKPAALALCGAAEGSPAIGMVQAAGLRSHMGPDERRNTHFLKSQIMVGADILCPWSAGYIGVYS